MLYIVIGMVLASFVVGTLIYCQQLAEQQRRIDELIGGAPLGAF